MTTDPELSRSLGLSDAVLIGLGSMIGAGIFAAFAPAAAAAGAGLIFGLVIAGVVAYCNATSSAQLAAQYPTSGGAYIYGRERLGAWPGFAAGWCFLIGKTASCAAMAMTFAAYAVPGPWQKPVAVAAVVALTGINYFGITRTATATRVIVSVVLAVLAVIAIAGLTSSGPITAAATPLVVTGGWYGVLQSAGLLFFAFAGYARIATLGEEVEDPARVIPKAILTALVLALAVYVVIAVSALRAVGPEQLAASSAPLVDVVTGRGWAWAEPIVRIGAAAAALGALLALIAGVGRTALAMARNRDLPRWLAAVHPRHQVPHHAELTLAAVVCAVVVFTDLRGAIGFSSFGVLLYYFIANVAAFTQGRAERRLSKAWQVLGATGCLLLVVTLPPKAIMAGLSVLLVGALYRMMRLQLQRA
ncbi:MAG: APC family permease [Gaiellales bacterium]